MSKAKGQTQRKDSAGNLSTLALAMMNVAIVAGLANDVQQAFYGLTSITYFVIGAIVFFIPTGLVAAELAGGWSERGGIFRWVGEGVGSGWAFVCIFILWFQTAFNFGSGISASSATIGFFTPDFNWAVDFAKADDTTRLIPIMLCWLAFYWVMCFLATKGITWFSRIAKYGVFIGTLIPLAVMTILCIVYIATGHTVNLDPSQHGLIPKWEGMSTLALAAGVFFSFTGIDMNAAHIKQLKDPAKQFPAAIFIAMILALVIFILGTIIIAIVIPNGQIDIVYTLYATYETLGATIGMPWLYMVFMYAGLGATMAMLITNLAGPSLMLGSAGRSGFLPKFLQNNNKHNMPSRLMYFQMIIMTLISFVVIFLPNVEGFFALVTQAITILYLIYYILMFIAFLRLRYTQPNRPRTFKIPGGNVFAWIVAGVGIAACLFGITLAFYPPAQIAKEVGSGFNYVLIIAALIAFVLAVSFGIYFLSRHRNWVDPSNKFAPFTWQIEGLKKPGHVESNVPVEMMSKGQNAMGMPIARPYDPNARIVLPEKYQPHKKKKDTKGGAPVNTTQNPAQTTAPQAANPQAVPQPAGAAATPVNPAANAAVQTQGAATTPVAAAAPVAGPVAGAANVAAAIAGAAPAQAYGAQPAGGVMPTAQPIAGTQPGAPAASAPTMAMPAVNAQPAPAQQPMPAMSGAQPQTMAQTQHANQPMTQAQTVPAATAQATPSGASIQSAMSAAALGVAAGTSVAASYDKPMAMASAANAAPAAQPAAAMPQAVAAQPAAATPAPAMPTAATPASVAPSFSQPSAPISASSIAASILSKDPDEAAMEAAQWAQEAADQSQRLASLSKALEAEAAAKLDLVKAQEAAMEAHAAAQQAAMEAASSGILPEGVEAAAPMMPMSATPAHKKPAIDPDDDADIMQKTAFTQKLGPTQ